ncbi:MAG: hypothetical protein IPP73_18830 [Chitinophagaceae bacterium]|nr:hypothetical protein [Chitinophagaceae bacterium]
MTTAISHRGPDAEGFFYDAANQIGLGHRRLSIIDLSAAANQPFYSHNGRYIMVFNGEIYNYKELAVKYNVQTRTTSDSEVILEAFAQVGIACINDFNGMFSLAIWDKEDKRLFIIRDRFGVKPLVYYHNGSDFAFCIRTKGIAKLPVKKKSTLQHCKIIFLEYVPNSKSILEGFKNFLMAII